MTLTGNKKRAYQAAWIKKRRDDWVAENGPCAKCGSTRNLEVDHIDPTQKVLAPRSLWSLSPTNPKRIAELAKCQVLCSLCHAAKTRADWRDRPSRLTYKHGSTTAYRYGCRCDLCRDAQKEADRGRRR